jgi:hypothetical protein
VLATRGSTEREVLAVSVLDQAVEHRIIEYSPPLIDPGVVFTETLVSSVDPILLNGGGRSAIVRSDLEPVAYVFSEAGASGKLR